MSTGRSRRRRCRPSDYPLQRRCRRRGGDMETRVPTISSTLLPSAAVVSRGLFLFLILDPDRPVFKGPEQAIGRLAAGLVLFNSWI
jgi:hypothetical protein